MSDVKVSELNELCVQWKEKQAEADRLADVTKELNKDIAKIKQQVAAHLTELNQEEYLSPVGKVRTTAKWQTKMPATPEQKAELWAWMREKGIYDAYATVHAVSLNSLFLAERKLAIDAGLADEVTFALPGMEPAKLFEDVRLTIK